ncbi:putative 2Fe-2S ferredoxin [Geobacillus sp. GHH01]|nr:putative 2Fe-2S ferredoxin [Geobacillus sp. GHH01]
MFGSDGCLRDYRQTCGRMTALGALFGPFTAFVYIFLHLCCRGAFSFVEKPSVCRISFYHSSKRGDLVATWDLRGMKHHVLICNGGTCLRHGGDDVTTAVREEIARLGLDDAVHTTRTRCNGRCQDACVMIVYPDGVWYRLMTPEKAKEVVHRHLQNGEPLRAWATYEYREDGLTRLGGTESVIGVRKRRT